MLQDRQVERTVLKVARLADMYSQFVVKAVIEPKVTINKNGKEFYFRLILLLVKS